MSVPDSVAVWTLRTGGVGAFGTKGLLNHHIAAATERETFYCFRLSEIFFSSSSKMVMSSAAYYTWKR